MSSAQTTSTGLLCLFLATITAAALVTADNCPPNWTYRVEDSGCYRYFTNQNYANAVKACEGQGAKLFAPKTPELNSFMRNMTKSSSDSLWVPLSDNLKEGTWIWQDGSAGSAGSGSQATWTNWHVGNPRRSTSYNCAYMTANDGTWYSYSCSNSRGYVCQMPVHVAFNITGDVNNITMECRASRGGYTLAAFMQIIKMKADGSEQPLVELIPGAQEPFFTDDDFIERSEVSGNLDSRVGPVYLKVVITKPGWRDAGDYRCSMTYIGSDHHLGGEVWADATLKD